MGNKGKGLLGRMYPGLTRRQAAAVVRQQLVVEQLRRQVVKSTKRCR